MSGGIEEIMLGLAKHLKIYKKQYTHIHKQQQHLKRHMSTKMKAPE